MYFIQHCFICRPSDSPVSEDAGIEPWTPDTHLVEQIGDLGPCRQLLEVYPGVPIVNHIQEATLVMVCDDELEDFEGVRRKRISLRPYSFRRNSHG
jgi:hypothetical protein